MASETQQIWKNLEALQRDVQRLQELTQDMRITSAANAQVTKTLESMQGQISALQDISHGGVSLDQLHSARIDTLEDRINKTNDRRYSSVTWVWRSIILLFMGTVFAFLVRGGFKIS